MKVKVLLITPPFTQLNTPYPATSYLKGFLNTIKCTSYQIDLGIETFLALFCRKGLENMFQNIKKDTSSKSENAQRLIALQEQYCNTIDDVIQFLQGKNTTLAYSICQESFLPQASRFSNLDHLDETFGIMGIQNKAKHLCTLYVEDLFDLIIECVDSNFGLNRYAEHLAHSANNFDDIYTKLKSEYGYIETLFIDILSEKIKKLQPEIICFSVPFPGNLFSALRCAQWIKKYYPNIKTVLGGGYANTELRQISDSRVFEFIDYILLDDGEAPLECLIQHIEGERSIDKLKRCFTCTNNQVIYINNSEKEDYSIAKIGTPDYSDLHLDKYVSFIETANPMHSLWSDGRWNKLTMAHGCYWAKCSFCDASLDYIKRYEPSSAIQLCDKIEQLIKQTGETGFHFVDEAAPPALMRELALEILRRRLNITWWTNIRFEKNFTFDVCYLLKASGCIAVSGGLEVASNRLLALINKGVTVEQVAKVADNFTQAGIMVHAYLMYGFPTQTAQETIDSLEMVRQLFEEGILHSAFWHKFTMTVHSSVGMYPEKFEVKCISNQKGTFANNDLLHEDKTGAKHEMFSEGLKTALYNYMHGIGYDIPLQEWFQFRTPRPGIPSNFIVNTLNIDNQYLLNLTHKLVWIANKPSLSYKTKLRKGQQIEICTLEIHTKTSKIAIEVSKKQGEWLLYLFDRISIYNTSYPSIQEIKTHYENTLNDNFEMFFYSKSFNLLREKGLLCL